MSFYQIFKMLCQEVGKTPTGVGKEISVDRATISYWKNNDVIPTSKALIKIADYFDVSIDYLCCRSDIRKPEIPFAISEHERAQRTARLKPLKKHNRCTFFAHKKKEPA